MCGAVRFYFSLCSRCRVSCAGAMDAKVAPDERFLETEDDGAGCLDSEFCELSAFSGAIPDGVTARYFVSAGDNEQAVADRADAEIVAEIAGADEAGPSSDEDSGKDFQPPCTAYDFASAFSVIRRCCGAMEGADLSHLDTVSKLKGSLINFMAQKMK